MFTVKANKKDEKDLPHIRLICSLAGLLLVGLLFGGEACRAGKPVSAEFLSSSGRTIELRVQAGEPQPSHVIVTLRIPPGLSVVDCQPQARKIDSKGGRIKWLLKMESGATILRVELNRPVSKSKVTAILSYRNPISGKFIESIVSR